MIEPTVIDAKRMAKENSNFRKVLFTGTRTQLVVMALLPGEEIGSEVHGAVDQLLYVVKGGGIAVLGDAKEPLGKGAMFCVPAGTTHNVVNTGDEPLKLFTLYSPPQHAAGTVHATKMEADAAEMERAAKPRKESPMALTNAPLITDRVITDRDDAKTAAAVRAALTWDAAAPEDRIESVVRGGVVSLKGTVDHWYQRASAVSAVKRLLGVTGVSDHIVVAPLVRTDELLRLEIKTALDLHFPLEDIDVTVDQGAATLMGTVASHRIRQDAEHLAWATTVEAVTNKILID